MPTIKIIVTLAGMVLYMALCHTALIMEDHFSPWRQLAVGMLIFPLIGFIYCNALWAIRAAGKGPLAQYLGSGVVALGAVGLAWNNQSILLTQLDILYLMQHLSINTLLCWFFLHTLHGGRTPIITAIARSIHKNIPDSIVRYTRKVTIAWAIFFAAQVLLSLVIFATTSIATWSVFANILHWPMIAAMFGAEYLCRKHYNPHFQHASIRQSVLAYLDNRKKI